MEHKSNMHVCELYRNANARSKQDLSTLVGAIERIWLVHDFFQNFKRRSHENKRLFFSSLAFFLFHQSQMTTLERQQPLSGGSSSTTCVHPSFIATKTISNVLANVKPTPSNRQMVDLPISATIEEAFDVLLAEDILSVPVYRVNEEDQTKVYVTIISVLDLLKLLSQHVSTRKKSPWEKKSGGKRNTTQRGFHWHYPRFRPRPTIFSSIRSRKPWAKRKKARGWWQCSTRILWAKSCLYLVNMALIGCWWAMVTRRTTHTIPLSFYLKWTL